MKRLDVRQRAIVAWTLAIGLLTEAATVALRFGGSLSAAQFNAASPPLLLQIHHALWSIPLLACVPFLWRWPRLSGALLGISFGLILSDLAHHFIVLPLTVGNTGWHWP
jgi:hypothetical protein